MEEKIYYHYDSEDTRLSASAVSKIFSWPNVEAYSFPDDNTVNIYVSDFGGLLKFPATLEGLTVNPMCASCI